MVVKVFSCKGNHMFSITLAIQQCITDYNGLTGDEQLMHRSVAGMVFTQGVTCADARDSKWQWHQLGRIQVCTSLQTDNHTR